MKKMVWILAAMALCLVAGVAGVYAFTYPSAQLTSYDPGTFTYIYRVDVTAKDSFAFGHFRVYAMVPNSGITSGWVAGGPVVGELPASGWSSSIGKWDVTADYVDWQAVPEAEVLRGTDWTGMFTFVAPNTQPVDGWLYTSDGPGSQHLVEGLVPGGVPAVPEPSSFLLAAPALLAMRKKLRLHTSCLETE